MSIVIVVWREFRAGAIARFLAFSVGRFFIELFPLCRFIHSQIAMYNGETHGLVVEI